MPTGWLPAAVAHAGRLAVQSSGRASQAGRRVTCQPAMAVHAGRQRVGAAAPQLLLGGQPVLTSTPLHPFAAAKQAGRSASGGSAGRVAGRVPMRQQVCGELAARMPCPLAFSRRTPATPGIWNRLKQPAPVPRGPLPAGPASPELALHVVDICPVAMRCSPLARPRPPHHHLLPCHIPHRPQGAPHICVGCGWVGGWVGGGAGWWCLHRSTAPEQSMWCLAHPAAHRQGVGSRALPRGRQAGPKPAWTATGRRGVRFTTGIHGDLPELSPSSPSSSLSLRDPSHTGRGQRRMCAAQLAGWPGCVPWAPGWPRPRTACCRVSLWPAGSWQCMRAESAWWLVGSMRGHCSDCARATRSGTGAASPPLRAGTGARRPRNDGHRCGCPKVGTRTPSLLPSPSGTLRSRHWQAGRRHGPHRVAGIGRGAPIEVKCGAPRTPSAGSGVAHLARSLSRYDSTPRQPRAMACAALRSEDISAASESRP